MFGLKNTGGIKPKKTSWDGIKLTAPPVIMSMVPPTTTQLSLLGCYRSIH